MGIYVKNCPNKETALKVMREDVAKDEEYYQEFFGFGLESLTLDKVREETYYRHRKCHTDNMEERICVECGEECGTVGRKAFAFYCV